MGESSGEAKRDRRQDDRPGSYSYRGHRHQARGETWLGSLLLVHVRQEHRGHHGEDSHVLAAHHCLLHHLLHLAGWLLASLSLHLLPVHRGPPAQVAAGRRTHWKKSSTGSPARSG